MPKRLTRLHYEKLAQERQLEWLGETVPKNVREKTLWRCPEGHVWETNYATIKYTNCGCLYCHGSVPKTEADYHELARQRGFKWLGPLVKNTATKTKWQCQKKHIWLMTYNAVGQGAGCTICAGNKPKTEADYHELAQQRGLIWLGPLPQNVNKKSLWRCPDGHEWLASYNSIRVRGLCPWCPQLSANSRRKTEADYHELAQQRGLIWLGPLPQNVNKKSLWRCQNGHEWLTSYVVIHQRGFCPWCPRPQSPASDQLRVEEDYVILAQRRGLEWLGPLPENTNELTLWRCAKNHEWLATYSAMRRGAYCPMCPPPRPSNQPKTEEEYQALAQARGLEWLGPMVPNNKTKTRWRCSQNHIWTTTFTVVRLNATCPLCLRETGSPKRKTPDDYILLAQERGLTWLGPEVKNTLAATRWRCPKNHVWATTYRWIRKRGHCPICRGERLPDVGDSGSK